MTINGLTHYILSDAGGWQCALALLSFPFHAIKHAQSKGEIPVQRVFHLQELLFVEVGVMSQQNSHR